MATAHGVAASLGYPYIRGDGIEGHNGVWLSRFTKTADGEEPAIYVGFTNKTVVLCMLDKHGRLIDITVSARKAKQTGRHRR